jgi:hypothetical protein
MAHSAELLNNEALYEASYTPEIIVSVDGVKTAPSTATLTLYNPSGTVIVSARACAIDGTTKKITATFTAAEVSTLTEDWRLLLAYEIEVDSVAIAYQANFLFDVCRLILVNPVIDEDLLALHPDLASNRWASQTTFMPQIEKAFSDIKRKLKERGKRARMMIDATQIKDLIICHSLELVFFDFAKDIGDIWWNRYLKRAEQFAADFENLHIAYDSDESGTIDEVVRFGNVNLNR